MCPSWVYWIQPETRSQKKKMSNSIFEGLVSLTDGVGVWYFRPFFFGSAFHQASGTNSTKPDSPNFSGCKQNLCASLTLAAFSDQLNPTDSSDQLTTLGLPHQSRKQKVFGHFQFFGLFSHPLFRTHAYSTSWGHFFQTCVDLLACQNCGGWVNYFLLPRLVTYNMNTSIDMYTHRYTCIYVPTQTHMPTVICIYTYIYTHIYLYYHAKGL